MNIILLEPFEADAGLIARNDRRAVHLVSVLRAAAGDCFAAGILNGKKGVMEILSVSGRGGAGENAAADKRGAGLAADGGIFFRFEAREESPPLLPLDLIIGLPRPLVTGRLLKDLTSLGARSLHFVRAELCEKSYMSGSLWKNTEYRRHVREGLEQAGATHEPEVRLHTGFRGCLAGFAGRPETALCALDRSAPFRLEETPPREAAVLAIGPERGWTAAEMDAFAAAGFRACRMGERVLRTEAAALAASAVMLSRMGLM